jgi:putative nucleotidyltransferase with HDIG domain
MTTSSRSEKTAVRLRLVDLPPFPAVALRALQLVSKSGTRLRELHDLISADPAFAAEILKLANSPLYGIRAEISSTLQATMLLGFERVKGLALTVGMKAYIGDSLQTPVLGACWRHSLACAMIAEELAEASLLDKDAGYTAALIHDIGRLALAVMQPNAYNELIGSPAGSTDFVLQRERELFGMDHCHAGRLLMTSWNLPEEFVEITSRHHSVTHSTNLDLLAVVALSCKMSDALGFSFIRSVDPPKYEELLGELPERERDHMPTDPAEMISRITNKMNCVESTPSPALEPSSDSAHPSIQISAPSN